MASTRSSKLTDWHNSLQHHGPGASYASSSYYLASSNDDDSSGRMLADHTSSIELKLLDVCVATTRETNADKRLRAVFDLFDVDQTGRLTPAGLQAFLASTMAKHNVTLCGVELHEIVQQAFEAANLRGMNSNQEKALTFADFKLLFQDTLDPRKSVASARGRPSQPAVIRRSKVDKFFSGFVRYQTELQFLALYTLINVAAFWLKWISFPYDVVAGYMAKLAKSCAQLVLLNSMLVLLPMCRSVVGTLRGFRVLWYIFPFDHNIVFHQIAAVVILVAGIVHTAAWIAIVVQAKHATEAEWTASILNKAKTQIVRYGAILDLVATIPIWTGVAMLLCAGFAIPFTFQRVRRWNFNYFWLTHMLFIPFLVFLCIHGAAAWVAPPQAWFWVVGPLALYFIERRFRVTTVFQSQTKLKKVHVMSSAMVLYMKKPRGFRSFTPGMYLFLKVPELSAYEWHPFTISSAPEDSMLSLHVRVAGDWTSALHARLQKPGPLPAIAIDGPVGAPSIEYSNYSTVVLIGGGIGVTPFASILKHLLHVWEEHRCPDCGSVQLPARIKLRKVHFYWVTKEQHCMVWFRDMLNQLSEIDSDGRLSIQTYLTNLSNANASAPLRLIQTYMQNHNERDIFTGLQRSKMHMGRPDWDAEFSRIARAANGEQEEIGVFLCGPPALDKDVNAKCNQYNVKHPEGVHYSYHSEKF
ncbi:unnamed protein product [Aphanomyces euteiches]